MKGQLMLLSNRILLRKRFLPFVQLDWIETVNDQLKHISQVEHTRHRKPANFAVSLIAGLIAYIHQSKKPSVTPGCASAAGAPLPADI